MPPVGWLDKVTGATIEFGNEWGWEGSEVGPELLAAAARDIGSHERTGAERFRFSPSVLMKTPRETILERFMPYFVDPEKAAGLFVGASLHKTLTTEAERVGYQTPVLEARGWWGTDTPIVGLPDGLWPVWDGVPKPFAWMPDLLEFKETSSGSMKFLVEAGTPKEDHVVQVNMYRHMAAATYGGKAEDISAVISYYCMPQKENSKLMGGWVRMPPCKRLPVPFMTLEEIGEVRAGWSPPRLGKDADPPEPPITIRETAKVLERAYEMIKSGTSVEDILGGLTGLPHMGCMCDRRFNGTGRTYCNVAEVCAMQDHGTPIW